MPYVFERAPGEFTDLDDLREWIEAELQKLEEAQAETTEVELRPVFAEPPRPREGMIVYADGVEWNPGSGKGIYNYNGTIWIALFT